MIYSHKAYTEKPDLEMFNMHTHDDYEIYCFMSGSAKYYVEGATIFDYFGDYGYHYRA